MLGASVAQVLRDRGARPRRIAREALQRIAALYAIEQENRRIDPEARRSVRQDRSRPLVEDLRGWLRTKLALINQRGRLAEHFRYALSRWDGFTFRLEVGRIDNDSDTVGRDIRSITLNRKNALLAGSDGGREHWATIASLI